LFTVDDARDAEGFSCESVLAPRLRILLGVLPGRNDLGLQQWADFTSVLFVASCSTIGFCLSFLCGETSFGFSAIPCSLPAAQTPWVPKSVGCTDINARAGTRTRTGCPTGS
jgi:hypothetical protein